MHNYKFYAKYKISIDYTYKNGYNIIKSWYNNI